MEHEYTSPLLTPEQLDDPSWIDNSKQPFRTSTDRYIEAVIRGRAYKICVPCNPTNPEVTYWRKIKQAT